MPIDYPNIVALNPAKAPSQNEINCLKEEIRDFFKMVKAKAEVGETWRFGNVSFKTPVNLLVQKPPGDAADSISIQAVSVSAPWNENQTVELIIEQVRETFGRIFFTKEESPSRSQVYVKFGFRPIGGSGHSWEWP